MEYDSWNKKEYNYEQGNPGTPNDLKCQLYQKPNCLNDISLQKYFHDFTQTLNKVSVQKLIS